MAKIKVISHKDADGRLKEIYDDLVKSRGKLADVHTIQSLRPESIVKHMDLYMEIMYSKSELSRAHREMMAVIVSCCNNCEYCQIHHTEALNKYWKNDSKINQLRKDYRELDLTEQEYRLCEFAELVTKVPGICNTKDITEPLKEIGLSDEAILDATLVISYFNFVNRIVLSLGVDIEDDSGTGYNY